MKKRRRADAPGATRTAEPAPPPINPAFAGLKAMRREFETRREAQARAAAQQRLHEVQRERDAEVFRRAVGAVTPIKPTGRVEPQLPSPPALPLKRWADDDAVLRESVSDEYGAEWLLDSDETLSHRRAGLGPDVVRRLRRGHWTISAQIDLHGLRVDEAREALGEFLRTCVRKERRCVRIIHGKGLGSVNRTPVLKEKVRRWLTQKDEVLAFVEARPDDGGSGVVLALLRAAN